MKHLSLVAVTCFAAAGSAARADAVDDYVRVQMRRQHIAGLSLAVVKSGKLIKAKGYGLANLELRTPATPDTVYQLASVTKQFVASAIMLLVQDGKIRLEDPITRYIAEAPERWKPVTVRHLLNHTSGIKDYLNELHAETREDVTPDKIVGLVSAQPLNFQPGERWSYSNTGYVLLGMVVRRVTGLPYDRFLQERAFKRLGMMETRRNGWADVIPNRAAGYELRGSRLVNSAYLNPTLWDNGDGGMLSSVRDLSRWDAALSSNGLLTSTSRDLMWSPTKLSNGGTALYGFGWGIEDLRGHRLISHSGGSPGAASVIARFVDDGLTVIVLTNGGGANPDRLAPGIAMRYVPGLAPARHAMHIAPETLRGYAGHYLLPGMGVMNVRVDGGRLSLDVDGRIIDEFEPVDRARLESAETARRLGVETAPSGEVTGVTMSGHGRVMHLVRLGALAESVRPDPNASGAESGTIAEVLRALAAGGKAVQQERHMTPGMREAAAGRPMAEFEKIDLVQYLISQPVSARKIELHGGHVDRVAYYKIRSEDFSGYALIYLTPEGSVADVDLLHGS